MGDPVGPPLKTAINPRLGRSSGLTLAFLSLIPFVGNIMYGAVGLRGTDQYWYAGDLRMSKITGMPVTNALYPIATGLNANASLDGLPPRIHNLPITYLANLVYQAGASDYFAWVYVNFSVALLIAVSVYLVARSQGYSYAYIAPAFFLSFPLTLWLSINALADMSIALGSCLLMLGATLVSRAVRDDGGRVSVGLLIIAVASVLLYYTRDNYVLLFPAQVIFTFWVCRSHRKRWVSAASILGITAILAALKHLVLPQYPSAGLLSLLMANTPSGGEGMAPYYRSGQVPFSASEVIFKAMNGLKDAVFPSGPSELITELPIIVIAVVALFVFRKVDNSRILRFWMFVVLVIYLTTAAIFQSQNRYIMALVPFVVVFGAGLWDRVIHRGAVPHGLTNVLRLTSVGFFIICVFGSFLLARTYRAEATSEVKQTGRLIAGLAREPSGSLLAVAETAKLLPLTYAAVPRPVLALDPRINSTAEAARLIEAWNVRVLVGATSTDLQYLSLAVDLAFDGRAKLVSQSTYETPGGPIKVWLIETGSIG